MTRPDTQAFPAIGPGKRRSALMNIKIPCLCGEMLNAGEAPAGSQVTCYKCGRPHVVPRLAQDRPARAWIPMAASM